MCVGVLSQESSTLLSEAGFHWDLQLTDWCRDQPVSAFLVLPDPWTGVPRHEKVT